MTKAPDRFLALHQFLVNPAEHLFVIDQFYQPNLYYPVHTDKISKISIVLNGQLKESTGRQEVYAKTASLVVKPQSEQHTNTFGPKGARVISVLVKDEYWLENDLNGILKRLQWFHDLQHARAGLRFVKELAEKPSANGLEENFIELLAALEYTVPERGTPPLWLSAVKDRLKDESETPPSLKALAQWVGVHPVYLARIFRKYYHCSIKDFIRTFRVQQVIGQLSSSQTPLVQIAMDAGYADQSHFSRQFKGEMGMSPGAFRKFFRNPGLKLF